MASQYGGRAELAVQLIVLQSRLFDVGSAVATPLDTASEAKRNRTQFDEAETTKLEGWIDEMEEQLPPLTNFILPSGLRLLAVPAAQAPEQCQGAQTIENMLHSDCCLMCMLQHHWGAAAVSRGQCVGGLAPSHLHVARAICRRAERATVPLIAAGVTDQTVGRYLNRLSDYLFVLARFVVRFCAACAMVTDSLPRLARPNGRHAPLSTCRPRCGDGLCQTDQHLGRCDAKAWALRCGVLQAMKSGCEEVIYRKAK